jgi:beta-lactamase class A
MGQRSSDGGVPPGDASLRRRSLVLSAAISLAGFGRGASAASKPQLHAELRRIAEATGGRMGVSALGVRWGDRVQLDANARYPMASTFKVAVAMTLLDAVDKHALTLSEPIEILPGNLSPGSGEINKSMVDEGSSSAATTLGELLDAMMLVSDNTATDHLMARLGGAPAVTAHLRTLGVTDIEVSRPAAQIVADSWGFTLPPAGKRNRKSLVRLLNGTSQAARARAAAQFVEDPRDTTTPDAMVALLTALVNGNALGKASGILLLDTMARCKTGSKRIKGQLPRGLTVAHKTGTLKHITTNDVGILTLSRGSGPLIAAIYLTGSPQPLAEQERAIASAAVALYRYYSR